MNVKDRAYNRRCREMAGSSPDWRMRSPSDDGRDNKTRTERGPLRSGGDDAAGGPHTEADFPLWWAGASKDEVNAERGRGHGRVALTSTDQRKASYRTASFRVSCQVGARVPDQLQDDQFTVPPRGECSTGRGEWKRLAALRAPAVLAGKGALPPDARRAPPPGFSEAWGNTDRGRAGVATAWCMGSQAAAAGIVCRHTRIPGGLLPSRARVRFGVPDPDSKTAPAQGNGGGWSQAAAGGAHAGASRRGGWGCQVRSSRSRALSRPTILRMTATKATLCSLPSARRRS